MPDGDAAPAVRDRISIALGATALTVLVSVVLIVFPLGLLIESIGVVQNYAGDPSLAAEGHVTEASAGVWVFGALVGMILAAATGVLFTIARRARLRAAILVPIGLFALVLIAAPIGWMLVLPAAGRFLA